MSRKILSKILTTERSLSRAKAAVGFTAPSLSLQIARSVAREAIGQKASFNRAWNELKNLTSDIGYKQFQSLFRESKAYRSSLDKLSSLSDKSIIPRDAYTPVERDMPAKYRYVLTFEYQDQALGGTVKRGYSLYSNKRLSKWQILGQFNEDIWDMENDNYGDITGSGGYSNATVIGAYSRS